MTIKSWVSILVSSNRVHLLQPYFSNLNKHLVKTPKIYFLDTGLCTCLTNWECAKTLESGAMSGAMFEIFVIGEIIKSYVHNVKEPNIYFYKDKDKREIDLIIERNGKLYPREIKKNVNPDENMIKNFSVIPDEKRSEGAVICLVKEDFQLRKKSTLYQLGIFSKGNLKKP